MQNNNKFFNYAQNLASQYNTFQSNNTIEQNILDLFEGRLPYDKSNNSLQPREFLNNFLLRYYPNETSVKSTFINSVLFKTKNHVSIFELNVGNSRLDLCRINKNSVAYEIKTDLDTPSRLEQQMKDYFYVFEKVYLICSEQNCENLVSYIPEECGIYTYYITKTGKYIFKRKRKALKSPKLSTHSQLSVLTKKDLNTFFECPSNEFKEEMIRYIIRNKTDKEINKLFKKTLELKFSNRWNFLVDNKGDIFEIDYQWFFKNLLSPEIVYL